VPARTTTLFEELTAAGRGVLALIVGDRRASDYFDFSRRGLAGSFIALLIAQLIAAYGPILLGERPAPGVITKAMIMVAILFAAQVGCSAIVLRQIGRLDGLGPYLVADNWATFYITLLSAILSQIGFGGEVALFVIGILVIVVEINIARVIVTLSALQIAMFLIAQLVGVSIGLIVVGVLFPGEAATTAGA
jgi:hypothetical protein